MIEGEFHVVESGDEFVLHLHVENDTAHESRNDDACRLGEGGKDGLALFVLRMDNVGDQEDTESHLDHPAKAYLAKIVALGFEMIFGVSPLELLLLIFRRLIWILIFLVYTIRGCLVVGSRFGLFNEALVDILRRICRSQLGFLEISDHLRCCLLGHVGLPFV